MFSHPKKRRLKPTEVFEAAVGLLLSLNFKPLERLCDNTSVLGQVFEKDGERLVLYYPGKDNEKDPTIENTARPLSSIYTGLQKKVGKDTLANALEVFFVCESNQGYKHYVLALKKNEAVLLYDSLSRARIYSLSGFRKLFPKELTLKEHYTAAQKDNNSCGIFVLSTLALYLENNKITFDNFNLDTAYQTMGAHYQRATGVNPTFTTPPPKKPTPTLTGYPKYLLIGALIGLTLAGVCVAAAFAWPLVLPAIGWLGVGLICGGAVGLSIGIAYVSKFISNRLSAPIAQKLDVEDDIDSWNFCSPLSQSQDNDRDTTKRLFKKMQAETGQTITPGGRETALEDTAAPSNPLNNEAYSQPSLVLPPSTGNLSFS